MFLKALQVLARGPLHCGNWVALFGLLSLITLTSPVGAFLFFPAAVSLSTAVQSFAAMLFGFSGAGLSYVAAILIVTLVAAFAGLSVILPVAFFSLFWLPVSLVALAWRRSQSLPIGLLVVAGLGLGLVVSAHLFLSEQLAQWQTQASQSLTALFDQAKLQSDPDAIRGALKYAVGMLVALLIMTWLSGVFLARGWSSRIQSGSPSFREEFYSLRMGKILVLPALGLLISGLTVPDSISVMILEVAACLGLLYTIQGIAVVHGLAYANRINRVWLWLMYVLFFFAFLPTAVLLFLLGTGDNWINFRQKTG